MFHAHTQFPLAKFKRQKSVVPQPWQTGWILVAAEVGVTDKMAKKKLFTSLVVLTAHLTVFNRFWMVICWKEDWSFAWVADICFFLRLYFHFGAKTADLADCSKVYHKVMSLSRMKGERDSTFDNVVLCIGMQFGKYEPLSCCKTKVYQFCLQWVRGVCMVVL